MLYNNVVGYCAGLLALVAAPLSSPAQEMSKPVQSGVVRAVEALKPEIVPSLIVMDSQGAILRGNTLTLTNVAPNVIVLADRPPVMRSRASGLYPIEHTRLHYRFPLFAIAATSSRV